MSGVTVLQQPHNSFLLKSCWCINSSLFNQDGTLSNANISFRLSFHHNLVESLMQNLLVREMKLSMIRQARTPCQSRKRATGKTVPFIPIATKGRSWAQNKMHGGWYRRTGNTCITLYLPFSHTWDRCVSISWKFLDGLSLSLVFGMEFIDGSLPLSAVWTSGSHPV